MEAAQVLRTPGGTSFREQSQLFSDLYRELDQLDLAAVSEFKFMKPPVEDGEA